VLGNQQPLNAEEVEKLVLARSKYQGSKSAAPMPLWIADSLEGGNHDRPSQREGKTTSSREGIPTTSRRR